MNTKSIEIPGPDVTCLDAAEILIDDYVRNIVIPDQSDRNELVRRVATLLSMQREALKKELAEARKDTERLKEARELLDLMYTKWEDGDPCYLDLETRSGYLGSAFDLNKDEQNRILAFLEADAALEPRT